MGLGMWALSCLRGFVSAKKAGKSNELHRLGNGSVNSTEGLALSAAAALPVVEASSLSAEWGRSQFPVACITLGEQRNGNIMARQVTVLWHNATSLDIWDRLTSAARNPILMEAMLAAIDGQGPAHQVVLVGGSTFTAQAAQPSAAAARFTSELLATVSVPVHISLVQFSTGPHGIVVPRALLLVCRTPLLPPRHIDAGPGPRQLRPVLGNQDTAYMGSLREDGESQSVATGITNDGGRISLGPPASAAAQEGGEFGGQASGNDAAVTAHRQRDSMVAAHLPAIITVFTLDGQVVHQNPASVQYMGPLPMARPHGITSVSLAAEDGAGGYGSGGIDEEIDWASGFGVLGYIFKYEQAKLRQMMDVLLGRGNVWQGIVRVPSGESLQQKLMYGRPPNQAVSPQEVEALPSEPVPSFAAARAFDTLQPRQRQRTLSLLQPRSAALEYRGHLHHHHHQQQEQQQQQQQEQHVQRVDGILPDRQPSEQQQRKEQEPELQRQEEDPERQRSLQQMDLGHQRGYNTQPDPQPQPHHPCHPSQQYQQLEERQGHRLQPPHSLEQQQDEGHPLHVHHPRQVGSNLASTLLDDGTNNTQNSSGSFMLSASRNNNHNHNNTNFLNTNTKSHNVFPQQLQQQESEATIGEVFETAVSDAAAPSGGPGQDLPTTRGSARASRLNLYDAEADPLATSTWTVLADPTSRGWPAGHHYNGTRTFTAGMVGNALRARAQRPSKRARQSAVTTFDSPERGLDDDSAAGAAVSLGLTRRWGSATQATQLPVGRRLPAAAPGPASGLQVYRALGSVTHLSHPHIGSGLGQSAGLGSAKRPGSAGLGIGSIDTTTEGMAATSLATAASKMFATGSRETSALAVTTATASMLERGPGPASLPMVRRVPRSYDGGGGSGVSGSSSMIYSAVRRADVSATISGAASGMNPTSNGVVSGAGSNATGISRVLVFANSLRSAPYAPAAAVTSLNSVQPASRLVDSGTSGSVTQANGIVQSPHAQPATTIGPHSKSCDRMSAAVRPSPLPDMAQQQQQQQQQPQLSHDTPIVQPHQQPADPPPSPQPLPPSLARPEVSALTAILRARRSTLANAAAAASASASSQSTSGMTQNTVDSAVRESPDETVVITAVDQAGGHNGMATSPSKDSTNVPALARLTNSGALILNPGMRRSSISGTVPTAMIVTGGEAELAMALLPYSQLGAMDRQLSNLMATGAPDTAGDEAAERASRGSADGTGGAGARLISGGGEYDVWHEISAVSALDPVTGAAVLVLTQVDVTAKVRAERHLVHVMCAERRLLLQLFPRHVLQHVVEANPFLHSHTAAGPSSLESLPREWLDGGDWRPVLRDCDKLATMHPQATVLFADIAGFDDICMELPPQKVLAFLNDLFAKFDSSIEPFGVHKMETIGGLFIVAGGLLREEEDGAVAVRDRWDPLHAEKVFMFAKAMLNVAAKTKLPPLEEAVKLRIGIHTGPVMSGIVGTRVPRFVLFGDTVNTASRMQTSATPGSVHVSEDTRALLPHENWTPTGGVQIKGKGLLNTYVWVPEDQIHYLVPPAVSTPESTQMGSGGVMHGSGGSRAAAAAVAAAGAGANDSRPGGQPPLLMSTMDISSCTSSDVFLAQQLSFTSAIPPTLMRGKSRLRHEGGYLDD